MKKWSLLLICFFVSLAPASPAKEQRKYYVKLTVTCDDDCKTVAKSYISRELRSLGDVVLIDDLSVHHDGPIFSLSVVGMDTKAVSGTRLGYVFSYTSTKRINLPSWKKFLESSMKPEAYESFQYNLAGLGWIDDHQIFTAGSDKLKEVCQNIAATFDADSLEPMRKEHREYVRFMNELDKK